MNRRCKYVLAFTILLLAQHHVRAQESSYNELQAIYIYNFAKYTSWPQQFDTFTIAIFDDAEMHKVISQKLADKTIKGKPIDVKLIYSVTEADGHQLIYLNNKHSRTLTEVLNNYRQQNILIVTENDLIKKGAMISFLVIGNKLRFKINPAALKDKELTASEGLLSLALN
ncbi:YfiR family protein [Fulvivirga ulvae]|uniref:YfiR family protein n=1 Tax=Fulvivirga ulvae TaxID=2904245 RepID=UPI001F43CB0E|nr:YfiR family protein [Fulvivirga ulvae]UII32945.1 YfiR family protein [Fulvivirga ulvae]